jgi:glucokinase
MTKVKHATIVGVDLGGTSLRALVVDSNNKVLGVEKDPTNAAQKPGGLIRDMAAVVERAIKTAGLKRADIAAVSVGAPGAADPEKGIIHKAPNLGWIEVPLAAELKKLLGLPVFVENDVSAGVIGEHALGAGEGTSELVGIFVGTGIGGGIITGGKLNGGSTGAAGELGHTVVLADGPVCSCGHRGCAEALASRWAMERDVRAAIKSGQKSIVLTLMEETNRTRMTSSIIAKALKKGDKVMTDVFSRSQYYLGILVANAVNSLDPERVVIGGGIAARLGEEYVQPARATAYEYFLRQADTERVEIRCGVLGDNANALGAVVTARKKLDQS